MRQASVLSCVKHGIGDEITLVGTLVAALLQAGHYVKIVTHHPLLYHHERIEVETWKVSSPLQYLEDSCDIKVCFDNPSVVILPLQFDVTPAVLEECRRLGYVLTGAMTGPNGVIEGGFYEFAGRIISMLGLIPAVPPWPFLARSSGEYALLNPFGNDSLEKGMPPDLAWSVLEGLLEAYPQRSFTLPLLNKMPSPPPRLCRCSNLLIEWFDHGSPSLLDRYLRAARVITSEGGGYHIAKAAGIPALLVTSRRWYAKTRLVLPPGPSDILLFEHDDYDDRELLHSIRCWLDQD
jgi:hypothetical protein